MAVVYILLVWALTIHTVTTVILAEVWRGKRRRRHRIRPGDADRVVACLNAAPIKSHRRRTPWNTRAVRPTGYLTPMGSSRSR
jgi:hypothetical protein